MPDVNVVLKPLVWVGTSLEDLREFPEEVRRTVGFALFLAQRGDKHPDAKPLKGFGSAGVLEVVENFDGNAYRAVYTVRFAGFVYALHAFQKKSRKGIKTSQGHIEKVKARLKIATALYEKRVAGHREKLKERSDEKEK